MEKENKKKLIPEINEELMMNLMVDGIKKEGLQLPQQEPVELLKPMQKKSVLNEPLKVKEIHDRNYERLFFKKPGTNARDGKTVYIRPDYHEKLSRIVQVIGEDKITIYAYLDNLLEYHFQEFREEITTSFNEKYKPIL
jgi:hypothetical protein